MINRFFSKKTAAKTTDTRQEKQNSLPDNAIQIAMQYHQKGDFPQAEALYQQILQQEPNHPDALHFFGVLLYQKGQNKEATELIAKAISICPTASPMHCNLGLALQALGELDAAVESFQKALLLQPNYIEALNNLGVVLQEQGKLEAAIENLQQAISLNPNYADPHNSLGVILKDQGKLDAAIESLQQAILLKPDYADAYHNLGVVFQEQGKLDAALKSYKKALEIKPDHVSARSSLGLLLLSLGQFKEGWQYAEARYDLRLKTRQSTMPNFPFPQWQGESIVGKTLVIWCEQGLGDEIQFCRYVSVLKAQGARRITWVCRKPLKELLKTLEAVDRVLTQEEATSIAPHDYWTFALSTPLHCKTTLDNIPAKIPYLYANPKLLDKFASELNPLTEFKIGVCWRGNPGFSGDALRSPGISWFKSIFKLSGVKFFTLQPGTRNEFMSVAGENAVDIGHEINAASFEEAAALIMNLDLIITSCTSICHLAGALGKPTWVVLPFKADWRWLVDQEDSPWYPNTRLFRQTERGNWHEVFQRVESRLKDVLAKKSPVIWSINNLTESEKTGLETTNFSDKANEYYNQGKLLRKQGNLNAAIESYQQTLLLKPDYADAYYDLGNICLGQGKLDLAIEHYRHAVAIKADFSDAYCNLGVALKEQDQLEAAIESYHHAIAITPDDAELYSNLGEVLWEQGKFEAAIENYQKALSLNPNAAIVHNNLGAALKGQGKLAQAVESYQRALVCDPDYSDAYGNLGMAFQEQGRLETAIDSLKKALALNPAYTEAFDNLFFTQLQCCDWATYPSSRKKIVTGIKAGEPGYKPFSFLAVSSSAAEQKQCAENYAKKHPLSKIPVWAGQRYQHKKIRIAYISADFREHPVSFLMAGLFEQHDRTRFEIIAISLEPEQQNSVTGQRVKVAFNQFIDVTHNSDYEVALLIRELEIDIAVDLMGFTKNCRPGIFSYRPAPIQINYLGYPGTMGTNYIDYIFADKHIIPPEQQIYYTEKVVYLPDSYLVNDSKRLIAEYTPTRAQVDLPEAGFVFCCFNNSYKITPDVFTVWMRLLCKVEGSVLWLSGGNPVVANNLRKEAILRGVSPERLIFAPRVAKLEEHLARLKLADLFLDTLPFSAHSTASDALWAGLPILTCMGDAFASRVAASLLNAVGLPELITHNFEEYEMLALKFATTPALLAEIRNKLAQNRNTYPLFDTDRFRRHIEAAYITMWERYQLGETPVSFAVSPQP